MRRRRLQAGRGDEMQHSRAVIIGGGTMGADVAGIFAAGGMAGDIGQRSGKTRDTLLEPFGRSVAELGGTLRDVSLPDALRGGSWQHAGTVVGSANGDFPLR